MTARRILARVPAPALAILARVPAPALAIAGVFGLEGGATIATTLIPLAGVTGVVALRLGFGAIGLSSLSRPRLRNLPARAVGLVIVLGAILAAHHLLFYASIHRLPLGVAVTLEFAGPLAVALAGSRRALDILWAALAALGVVATAALTGTGRIEVSGVIFALAAGACWAGYILVFPRLAVMLGRARALSLATAAAAIGVVPYAVASEGHRLWSARVLLLGAAVAVCSDVIAYSLQAEALHRMPGRLFSILSSTEPGAGAMFGWLALGQDVTAWQWAGMLAVAGTSIGATLTDRHDAAETRGQGSG